MANPHLSQFVTIDIILYCTVRKFSSNCYSLQMIPNNQILSFISFVQKSFRISIVQKPLLIGSTRNLGYIIPGHGLKGKKQVLNNNESLQAVYAIC